MPRPPEAGPGGDPAYVSTGHLPSPDQVRRAVEEAHARYRMVAEGERSRVYPALARVPAGLFGICAVGTSGRVAAAGDAEARFTIMSVAKPFVFAWSARPSAPRRAIATTSLAPGEAAWAFLTDGLARFAGRPLPLDEEVYASASATNHRNRSIANLLESHGGLGRDPAAAVELYTRQSSLAVTATALAVMGATLADAGSTR